MRTTLAAALAYILVSSHAMGRSKAAAKAPRAGQFCADTAVGTTAQDSSG